jgi:hypothetical protein
VSILSGSILLALLVLVAFAPRRWAFFAMLAATLVLTQGHSVDLAGLNLYPVRFLEAIALARVIVRGELTWATLTRVDFLLVSVYNYAALVWILRSPEFKAEQFASAVDPTLCYLALRGLITKIEDLRWALNALVVLLIPYTCLVALERLTGQSSFLRVGAASELLFRDGQARAQGSFRHAILLGSVAASFLSLYIGLLFAGRRTVAALGVFLCLILVALTNSSGPVTSVAAVFVGWLLWPMRHKMSLVRKALLSVLVLLLFVMEAPIWYLPFKISELVGGGGYHRGLLMDRAWQDLGRWWLFGMDMKDTAPWFPYVLQVVGGADITNEFVSFGLKGGLLVIVLFVAALVLAFKRVGMALRSLNPQVDQDRRDAFLIWALGVTLFCHIVSWLGVSYFDQTWVIWLAHFAAIVGVAEEIKHRRRSADIEVKGPVRSTIAPVRPTLRRAARPVSNKIAIRTANFTGFKGRFEA